MNGDYRRNPFEHRLEHEERLLFFIFSAAACLLLCSSEGEEGEEGSRTALTVRIGPAFRL